LISVKNAAGKDSYLLRCCLFHVLMMPAAPTARVYGKTAAGRCYRSSAQH
jgi:hypothetical protein